MKNSIEKGLLGYNAYPNSSLEAGSVALYKLEDEYKLVTLMHLDVNERWYVTGDYEGYTVPDPTFYYIVFYGLEDILIFNPKYWSKIIKDGLVEKKEEIECVVSDYPFKEGKYTMTCTECNASFLGAKQQPFCKECCSTNATVSLLDTKTKSKKKRVRIKSKEHVSKMLKEAYTFGFEGMVEDIFNEWVDENLKKWQ